MAWALDVYGSTATPDLRVLEGATVRATFNAGTGMTVNGRLIATVIDGGSA